MLDNDKYTQFRESWILRHRSSVPVQKDFQASRKYPPQLAFIVFMMLISAGAISAVHTIPTVLASIPSTDIIPEFVRQIVSIGAFIAVEISVFVSAYIMDKQRKMALSILVVSFSVAIVANISSVFSVMSGRDLGSTIVGIALGMGAPLMALLAGKIYVEISKQVAEEDSIASRNFQEAKRMMDSKILAEFSKLSAKTEAEKITVEKVPVEKLSTRNSNKQLFSGIPAEKNSVAATVEKYFQEHPEMLLEKPSASLEPLRGIAGKSTVFKVWSQMNQKEKGDQDGKERTS